MSSPEKNIAIAINKVTKSFGDRTVLNEFTLNVVKGENVVVLGRSGSGKSVLIKCIIGLHQPDSGHISVLGIDIGTLDHPGMDKLRARVGFLFQSNALYDSMTVRENLFFPMRRHVKDITATQAEQKIMETLEHVGLAHTASMMPSELSGGMQKRIALARTLVLNPEVILYDEPTTGLDPITAREISTLINDTQKRYNTTSVIISHDMKCVEHTADRIAVLLNGQCYKIDTYESLRNSNDAEITRFFE